MSQASSSAAPPRSFFTLRPFLDRQVYEKKFDKAQVQILAGYLRAYYGESWPHQPLDAVDPDKVVAHVDGVVKSSAGRPVPAKTPRGAVFRMMLRRVTVDMAPVVGRSAYDSREERIAPGLQSASASGPRVTGTDWLARLTEAKVTVPEKAAEFQKMINGLNRCMKAAHGNNWADQPLSRATVAEALTCDLPGANERTTAEARKNCKRALAKLELEFGPIDGREPIDFDNDPMMQPQPGEQSPEPSGNTIGA